MTDTLGLLLKVKVLPANVTDRDGGEMLLKEYREAQPGLRLHLFVDGGYKGKWETLVRKTFGHTVEMIQRPDANIRGYWPGFYLDRSTKIGLIGSCATTHQPASIFNPNSRLA